MTERSGIDEYRFEEIISNHHAEDIIKALNLQEKDQLEISVKNGVIVIEPVAVYAKSYIRKLEETVMRINEDPSKDSIGPFKSVEEAMDYLEAADDEDDEKVKNKTNDI